MPWQINNGAKSYTTLQKSVRTPGALYTYWSRLQPFTITPVRIIGATTLRYTIHEYIDMQADGFIVILLRPYSDIVYVRTIIIYKLQCSKYIVFYYTAIALQVSVICAIKNAAMGLGNEHFLREISSRIWYRTKVFDDNVGFLYRSLINAWFVFFLRKKPAVSNTKTWDGPLFPRNRNIIRLGSDLNIYRTIACVYVLGPGPKSTSLLYLRPRGRVSSYGSHAVKGLFGPGDTYGGGAHSSVYSRNKTPFWISCMALCRDHMVREREGPRRSRNDNGAPKRLFSLSCVLS